MTATDHTTRAWTRGYAAGNRRGHEDGQAETLGRYTRDPSHEGHSGETPDGLSSEERGQWADGFLEGYARGRSDAMRGAA